MMVVAASMRGTLLRRDRSTPNGAGRYVSIPNDAFKVNDTRSLQFSVLAELSPLRQTALARRNTTKLCKSPDCGLGRRLTLLLPILIKQNGETVCKKLVDRARHGDGLCCTNPMRDSSRESSMIAVVDEQTEHTDLQDPELARV